MPDDYTATSGRSICAQQLGSGRRATAGPRFKLPSGEASGRLRRDTRARLEEGHRHAAGDGWRRQRADQRRTSRALSRRLRQVRFRRQATEDRRLPFGCGRFACCRRSRNRLDWRRLEAMACEVPVIASRVGGLPEVVTDGETGFLSEVGDVDKMADAAARLLTDETFRSAMGVRARESALSRYSTDIVIPQYIKFYEQILAR